MSDYDEDDLAPATRKAFADDQTRLYRIKSMLFKAVPDVECRWENPVPIYSGSRLVGAAVLDFHARDVYATLMLDYESPERLDIETSAVWAIPDRVKISQTYRPCECGRGKVMAGRVMTIGALRLSPKPMDPGEYPLTDGLIL